MRRIDITKLDRRELIKLSLMAASATVIGGSRSFGATGSCIDQTPMDIEVFSGIGVGAEAFPTSPFVLNPFTDPLPIPRAMLPGYRTPEGELKPNASFAWAVRTSAFGTNMICRPGPGASSQDSMGQRARYAGGIRVPDAGTHQLWTDGSGVSGTGGGFKKPLFPLPDPLLYHIRLQLRQHSFTSSKVQPIDKAGLPIVPPTGSAGPQNLPMSTIYGFNGTFPGPMINNMYGQPSLVRFENDLDFNPLCLDRQDFGAPDWAFLTHLHNGHSAPECDGNPHHMTDNKGGYLPSQWVDNLYLNWAPDGDSTEKQSFFWFHDHRMHHTGANVYIRNGRSVSDL
jgi:hypothetical protein